MRGKRKHRDDIFVANQSPAFPPTPALSVGSMPLWMKQTFSFSGILFFLSYIVFLLTFMQNGAESVPQEPTKNWALPSGEIPAHDCVSEGSGGVFWWSRKLGGKKCKVWWVIFSISDSDLWAEICGFCIIRSIHSYIKLAFLCVCTCIHFMPVNFCCVYSVFMKANSNCAAKCFAVNPLPCSEVSVCHRRDVLWWNIGPMEVN